MTKAWLIENHLTGSRTPVWWCGGHMFSANANEAVRFARKQDAEKARLTIFDGVEYMLVSTEHGWHDETES